MSRQQRRDYVWLGRMAFALGFFNLCAYGWNTGFFT